MQKNFKVCYRAGQGEIVEKKSKFISNIVSVKTEEEANSFIEKIKKEHYSARHNCYAYIIGEDGKIYKYSDDGEPGGTAGRPMLDILINENLVDVCVVVTRYFGGTLLGTGGLVRAYTESLKTGLKNAKLLERKKGIVFNLRLDYTDFGKIKYFIEENKYFIMNIEYTQNVYLKVLLPSEDENKFRLALGNIAMGKIETDKVKLCTYLVDGDKAIFENELKA